VLTVDAADAVADGALIHHVRRFGGLCPVAGRNPDKTGVGIDVLKAIIGVVAGDFRRGVIGDFWRIVAGGQVRQQFRLVRSNPVALFRGQAVGRAIALKFI